MTMDNPSDDEWVALRLVPVEFSAMAHGDDDVEIGVCLSDAVQAWSDCNRAIGRIYRVDETDPQYREPGDTVEIRVRRTDLPWFEKRFGDEFDYPGDPERKAAEDRLAAQERATRAQMLAAPLRRQEET